MCGRYSRFGYGEEGMAEYLEAISYVKDPYRWDQHNIKPTTDQLMVYETGGERKLTTGKWGWYRSFGAWPQKAAPAKAAKVIKAARGSVQAGEPQALPKPKLLINARGEEASAKRTWALALRQRRCLIPASSYFEWRPSDKQPFAFGLETKELFGIGGLWEDSKEHGVSFVLLTTPPNKMAAEIHDRMPLILQRKDHDAWLDPATDENRIQSLIAPLGQHLMAGWPVSKLVSGIHNEGPELVQRVTLTETP
jgi:putative SOS response-associated peptidase YedK